MQTTVQVKLFASLHPMTPAPDGRCPIEAGTTVEQVLNLLEVPLNEAKLIFINGRKGELGSILWGGERVGVFPPVGGG
jgi:sulfur-carrier protein